MGAAPSIRVCALLVGGGAPTSGDVWGVEVFPTRGCAWAMGRRAVAGLQLGAKILEGNGNPTWHRATRGSRVW